MDRHRESGGSEDELNDALLMQMIQTLRSNADMPPREVEGVSEEFCDGMINLRSLYNGYASDIYYFWFLSPNSP